MPGAFRLPGFIHPILTPAICHTISPRRTPCVPSAPGRRALSCNQTLRKRAVCGVVHNKAPCQRAGCRRRLSIKFIVLSSRVLLLFRRIVKIIGIEELPKRYTVKFAQFQDGRNRRDGHSGLVSGNIKMRVVDQIFLRFGR